MAGEINIVNDAIDMVSKMRHAWVRSGDAPATRNNSFLPRYDFNNKHGLLNAHQELMNNDGNVLPVSPDPATDIHALLTNLKTQIQTQQTSLIEGFGFNKEELNKAIAAAQTAVEKSAAVDASAANLKACNKVTENLKHMQEEVLAAELEDFIAELKIIYNDANNERVYDQMMAKYGDKTKEMLWEKITDFDEEDLQKEIDEMNDADKSSLIIEDGSNKEFLKKQKKGVGVYRAPGSEFNILLSKDENGELSCQATFAKPEVSGLRLLTNLAIDLGELYVRAPTLPLQAGLAFFCQLAGIVNKQTGAPKIPYPTIGTFTRGKSSPADMVGRKTREQMDFMAMKAGATSITYNIAIPQQGPGVTEYFVRNAYLALMEAEKRAGFDDKATPKVKFPDAAMLFQLSESLRNALVTSNSIKGVLPETANYMRLHGASNTNDSVSFLLQRIQKLNLAIKAQQELTKARANSNDEQVNFKKALQEPKPAPTPTFPAPVITPAAALAKAPTPTPKPKAPTPTPAPSNAGSTPNADALAAIRAGKKNEDGNEPNPLATIRAGARRP